MTQPKEDTALGLARTRFIEALPQKAAELHASIARVRETNEDEPSRDELRRRFHALYASSQVFRIEPLARSLKSCLDAIDAARAEKRTLEEAELKQFARILDAVPELAKGERSSLVPEASQDDSGGSSQAYSVPKPGEMTRSPKSPTVRARRSSMPTIERRPSMSFRPRTQSSPSNVATSREFTSRRAAATLRCDRVLVLMMIGGEPITQRILPVFPSNRVEVIQCANEREAVELARVEQPDTIAIAPSYAKSAKRALEEAGLGFIPRVQLSPAGASEKDYGGFGAFGVVAVNAPPVQIAQLIIDAASGPSESALRRTLEPLSAAPRDLPDLSAHEVVIAFDTPGVTEFLASELSALGLKVHRAGDSERAILLARLLRPSLVLAQAAPPNEGAGEATRDAAPHPDEAQLEEAVFGDPSLLRTRLCFLHIPEPQRERMIRGAASEAEAIEAGRYGLQALLVELLAWMGERGARLQNGEPCRGRLRGTGNVELLEAVARTEGPLRLEVRDAARFLEIELLGGAVKAARFTSSSGDFLRGDRALDRLPRFVSGRFRLMPSKETDYKGPTIAEGTIERLKALAMRASATLEVLRAPKLGRGTEIELDEAIVRGAIFDEAVADAVLGAKTVEALHQALAESLAQRGEEEGAATSEKATVDQVLGELIAAAAFRRIGAAGKDAIGEALAQRALDLPVAEGAAGAADGAKPIATGPRARSSPSVPAVPSPSAPSAAVRPRPRSSDALPKAPPPLRRESSVAGVPLPKPPAPVRRTPSGQAFAAAGPISSEQAPRAGGENPPIATAPPLPARRESSVTGVPLPKRPVDRPSAPEAPRSSAPLGGDAAEENQGEASASFTPLPPLPIASTEKRDVPRDVQTDAGSASDAQPTASQTAIEAFEPAKVASEGDEAPQAAPADHARELTAAPEGEGIELAGADVGPDNERTEESSLVAAPSSSEALLETEAELTSEPPKIPQNDAGEPAPATHPESALTGPSQPSAGASEAPTSSAPWTAPQKAPVPEAKRSSREWFFGVIAAALVFGVGFFAIEYLDLNALFGGASEETSAAEKARDEARAKAGTEDDARRDAEALAPLEPPLPEIEPLYGRIAEGVGGSVPRDHGLLILELGELGETPFKIQVGGETIDPRAPQKALAPGRHEIVIERGSETLYRYIFVEAGKTRTLSVP